MQHFNDVVWSTPLGLPGRYGKRMHQHSTSGTRSKRKKGNKNKKMTLHISTHGTMQGCGLTLMVYINDKIRDIRERNVTTWSERFELRTSVPWGLGIS